MSGAEPSSSSRRVEAVGEEEGPARRTRGIRGGLSAKRRREAYIRHLEAEGFTQVPIARPGGQARPLGTSRLWSPSNSEAETDPGVIDLTEESSAVLTQQVQPTWLGPRPKSRPQRPNSSSSSAPRVIRNVSTSHLVDNLRFAHPPPSVDQHVGELGATPLAQFDPSVKVYIWDQDLQGTAEHRALRRSTEGVPSWPGAVILAYDYHQVLDVDRWSKFGAERIGRNLLFPRRHLETLASIRSLIESGGGRQKLVLCSHIHDSESNLRNLLNVVQTSQAPFDLVLITTERKGPKGKLSSLRALAPSGNYCLLDDNPEIAQEFAEARVPFIQIRKPRQRLVVPQRYSDWSASGEVASSFAKRFLADFQS